MVVTVELLFHCGFFGYVQCHTEGPVQIHPPQPPPSRHSSNGKMKDWGKPIGAGSLFFSCISQAAMGLNECSLAMPVTTASSMRLDPRPHHFFEITFPI